MIAIAVGSRPRDFSQTGHLTANVRIASLSQWGSLQTAMTAVPNVSSVAVQAMDIGEARVTLNYLGLDPHRTRATAKFRKSGSNNLPLGRIYSL